MLHSRNATLQKSRSKVYFMQFLITCEVARHVTFCNRVVFSKWFFCNVIRLWIDLSIARSSSQTLSAVKNLFAEPKRSEVGK